MQRISGRFYIYLAVAGLAAACVATPVSRSGRPAPDRSVGTLASSGPPSATSPSIGPVTGVASPTPAGIDSPAENSATRAAPLMPATAAVIPSAPPTPLPTPTDNGLHTYLVAGNVSYIDPPPSASPAPGFADGKGAAARFHFPFGLLFRNDGALWVSDYHNNVIRLVMPDGTVTTAIGAVQQGSAEATEDGTATSALFEDPSQMAAGADGALYVIDWVRGELRRIPMDTLEVSTMTGGELPSPVNGINYKDGVGKVAQFFHPSGLAATKDALFVADTYNNCIRRISLPDYTVTLYAGKLDHQQPDGTTLDFADGPAAEARFNHPEELACDGAGNLYVADAGNNRIRKVTPAGDVSTVAGGAEGAYADGPGLSARFQGPEGLALDDKGRLVVGDTINERIRRIDLNAPGNPVTTLAGSGIAGYAEGPAMRARFHTPIGVAVNAAGDILVADFQNNVIRRIAP